MVREVNSITCTAWVPRGAAKRDPEKITVEPEVLRGIIAQTKDREDIEELDEDNIEENDYEALELKAQKEELKITEAEKENIENEMLDMDETEDKSESIQNLYHMDTYEQDPEETLMRLGKLTVHAEYKDDPNIIVKDDDEKSDLEDYQIIPTDNLITVGHVDGESYILEVYVYNSVEESLFVHHDCLLPAVPYCMEWLDFDPEAKELCPGNLLAIGYQSPVIEVWDMNIVDTIEPAFSLGKRPKKKKNIPGYGHTDAVLCLGWNRELSHIFASGSADQTVKLWDIQLGKVAQDITCFDNIIYDLKWDQTGKQLLTACGDKLLRLHDFSSNAVKSWTLDGEVECVSWGNAKQTNNIYACSDVGTLYGFDKRQTKPLFKTKAHENSCTGIVVSPSCPGCLVTGSEDKTFKIWDVLDDTPKLIEHRKSKVGIIHTVSASPDDPFVICLGGDNKDNNFMVWDMRQSLEVRKTFCERLGLPVDINHKSEGDGCVVEDEEGMMDYKSDFKHIIAAIGSDDEVASASKSTWKPTPKSKKKKGGHLDKKKKKKC